MKVYELVSTEYYWHGMWRIVYEFIRRCCRCQQFMNAPRPFRKPLRVRREEDPFGCVAIDFIVELPLTARGNKNILVVSDMFTKWAEAYALLSKTAEAVADALFLCVDMAYRAKFNLTRDPNS